MNRHGALVIGVLGALALAGCGIGPGANDSKTGNGEQFAADYLENKPAIDSTTGLEDIDPKPLTTTLNGPHFRLTLDWTARATTLDHFAMVDLGINGPDDSPVRVVKAADDHEFLIVHVDEFKPLVFNPAYARSADDPEFAKVAGAVSIEVDGKERKLPNPVATNSSIVVSVPKGEDAVIKVADSDKTQSIAMADGKIKDTVPLYNPLKQAKFSGISANMFSINGAPIQVAAVYLNALLAGYADGLGWAKDGRAWVLVDAKLQATVPNLPLKADGPSSFKLKLADGSTVRASTPTVESATNPVDAPLTLVAFDVPASTTGAAVSFSYVPVAGAPEARPIPGYTGRTEPVPFTLS